MGVPKFYRWLSERYPCLSEVVKEYQIPEFDNLYLDMNGIIHVCSHPNDADPHFRITEEQIFEAIFHYIECLFRMIQPRKVFFMAVDGVAPRAKMNQQRGRRFRSAKEAEILEHRAKERGEILPTEERFDSNCITPGTAFMARLQDQLKYFVNLKISTDKQWNDVNVYLSGHETPGEGEHKIMDFIRWQKSQAGYDPNTRHCLYGLDADLIMLGLCTHEPHFSLLREEVRFGGKKSQQRTQTPEETTFHLLHLSLLREYLGLEFAALQEPGKLPFQYDLERVIDDWVLMGFLVGNDFIPHLPDMHIVHGALPALYCNYIDVLPTLDGYINEDGYLNLERFEKFMVKLSQLDYERFNDTYADLKYFEGKTGRKMGAQKRPKLSALPNIDPIMDEDINDSCKESPEDKPLDQFEPDVSHDNLNNLPGNDREMDSDLKALIDETEEYAFESEETEESKSSSDEAALAAFESDDPLMLGEFKQHKRDYYMNKLEYKQVTSEVMQDQAQGYVRAIQWNLHYYYNGVCSWSWYYPHHYAPYISDIKNFSNFKLEFDMGRPFLPFEQLLAVLPAASGKLLPAAYQSLMINPESPILEYYPPDFKTDLNGKQQEWEAVVLIPFISEERLVTAMTPLHDSLTDEEKNRNKHGPMNLYTYTPENLGKYESPGIFPDIDISHAQCTEVSREDLFVEPAKLKKGLCPDVKLDVYYPGFPTLKHIPHKGSLEKKGVKVFDNLSRGENMMLYVCDQGRPNVQEVAEDLLGKEIYVAWPHLVEARVVSLANADVKYRMKNKTAENGQIEIEMEDQDNDGRKILALQEKSLREHYFSRLGVELGEIDIILQCCPMTGRKYIFGHSGRITLEKQYSRNPFSYALQTTVKDIAAHCSTPTQFSSLSDVFPEGSSCFMLGHPHYGCHAEVVSVESRHNGLVNVIVFVEEEPALESVRRRKRHLRPNYLPGHVAAQRLGISSHVLSRITGSMYVSPGNKERHQDHRANLGLNLKFTKKNEEVPGYTRKTLDGAWTYSEKAVRLLEEYMTQFEDFVDFVASSVGNDVFFEDDIWRVPGSSRVQEMTAWLKAHPYSQVGRQKCGTEILEEEIVAAIEEEVRKVSERNRSQRLQKKRMQVQPHLLYKSSLQTGCITPDPSATYSLFDRVVCVKEGGTVPVCLKGTVIGVHKAEKEVDIMYDVVFDREFVGGMVIRCEGKKGYRLGPMALLNISYGARVEQARERGGRPTAIVRPVGEEEDDMEAENDRAHEAWQPRSRGRGSYRTEDRRQQQNQASIYQPPHARNLRRPPRENNKFAANSHPGRPSEDPVTALAGSYSAMDMGDAGRLKGQQKFKKIKQPSQDKTFPAEENTQEADLGRALLQVLNPPAAVSAAATTTTAPIQAPQPPSNVNLPPPTEFMAFWNELQKKDKEKESGRNSPEKNVANPSSPKALSGDEFLKRYKEEQQQHPPALPPVLPPHHPPPAVVPHHPPTVASPNLRALAPHHPAAFASPPAYPPMYPPPQYGMLPAHSYTHAPIYYRPCASSIHSQTAAAPSPCEALMQDLQKRGLGVPRYQYFPIQGGQAGYKAICILPTGAKVMGDAGVTKEEASNKAAGCMLTSISRGKVMLPPHPLQEPPQWVQGGQAWQPMHALPVRHHPPPFPQPPPAALLIDPVFPDEDRGREIEQMCHEVKVMHNLMGTTMYNLGRPRADLMGPPREPPRPSANDIRPQYMLDTYGEHRTTVPQTFVPMQVTRKLSKTQEQGGVSDDGTSLMSDEVAETTAEQTKAALVGEPTKEDFPALQDSPVGGSKKKKEPKKEKKQRPRLAAKFSKAGDS